MFAWHGGTRKHTSNGVSKNGPQILHKGTLLCTNVTHIVTLPFICHIQSPLIILNLNHPSSSCHPPIPIYNYISDAPTSCIVVLTWDWYINDKCLQLTKPNALEQLEQLLANWSLMQHPVPCGSSMFGQDVSRVDMAPWGRNMQLKIVETRWHDGDMMVWCPWFMRLPVRIPHEWMDISGIYG